MSTGACGINCDICRLNLLEICSTCGPGRSQDAEKKLAAQKRILGTPCSILACATERGVKYCPRDCHRFPCEVFRAGPYPFGNGYLNMQERRRRQMLLPKAPSGDIVKVPQEYWADLAQKDIDAICENAGAKNHPPTALLLPFLKEYVLVDRQRRSLFRQAHAQWEPIDNPLLELVCLVYLLNAGPEPLAQEMISVQDLKNAHFFAGPHELKVKPLLTRYGEDLQGFKNAAERVGGEALDLANIAYEFLPFPKVPLYYLLWAGDEEFPPSLSILFDRSVEHHLAADAIWGLVTLVSEVLLIGDRRLTSLS
jgi:hypothetical protein